MPRPSTISLSAHRRTEDDANRWNAFLRPRGNRGSLGGHGRGFRARRYRGVDDHALSVKGCPNFHRVPYGSPGPILYALVAQFQNQRLKAAAAAEVTAAVSSSPAGPLGDPKGSRGSHMVRAEAERVHDGASGLFGQSCLSERGPLSLSHLWRTYGPGPPHS